MYLLDSKRPKQPRKTYLVLLYKLFCHQVFHTAHEIWFRVAFWVLIYINLRILSRISLRPTQSFSIQPTTWRARSARSIQLWRFWPFWQAYEEHTLETSIVPDLELLEPSTLRAVNWIQMLNIRFSKGWLWLWRVLHCGILCCAVRLKPTYVSEEPRPSSGLKKPRKIPARKQVASTGVG